MSHMAVQTVEAVWPTSVLSIVPSSSFSLLSERKKMKMTSHVLFLDAYGYMRGIVPFP